jgi:hypothetical protein
MFFQNVGTGLVIPEHADEKEDDDQCADDPGRDRQPRQKRDHQP